MLERDSDRRARSSALARLPLFLGLAFALAAALCSAQSLWGIGFPHAVLAVPIVFAGAAWPIVLLWSPTEPSPLKLALLAGVGSPPLYAATWAVARSFLDPAHADAATMGCFALLQLAALHRRLAFEPLGKAAWLALALAAAAAIVAARSLLANASALLWCDGVLWHSGIALGLERRFPPENPWLAAASPSTAWSFDVLVRTLARALDVFPALALATAAALAALWTGIGLALLGAPLWRELRRALAVPLCAWFGPHALGGILDWFPGRAPQPEGRIVESGLAPFLDPGPSAPLLALCVAIWLCAAHALRHGRRPWVGLCGMFSCFAVALDPPLGLTAVLPVVLVALVHPGASGVRERVLAALLLSLVPALAVASFLGWRLEPVPRSLVQVDGRGWLEALALLVLAALPLVRGRWQREGGAGDERGRRTILWLLVTALLAAIAAPWTCALFAQRQLDFLRLATLVAAVLAAGGIVDLARSHAPLALALVLALGAGGGSRLWKSMGDAARRAERTFELALESDGLRSTRDDDLARAYDWLRTNLARSGKDPVLLRSVSRREDHLGRNHIPHVAPLLSGLSTWCDWSDDHAGGDPRWEPRHDRLERLYAESRVGEPATDWDPTILRELDLLGRPAVILVEEDDRRATRMQIERRLSAIGARLAHEEGSVALWSWESSTDRAK